MKKKDIVKCMFRKEVVVLAAQIMRLKCHLVVNIIQPAMLSKHIFVLILAILWRDR